MSYNLKRENKESIELTREYGGWPERDDGADPRLRGDANFPAKKGTMMYVRVRRR